MKVWLGAALAALFMAGTAHAMPVAPPCTMGTWYGETPDYACNVSATVAGKPVEVDCRQETYTPGPPPWSRTNGCVVRAGQATVPVDRCESYSDMSEATNWDLASSEHCATGVGPASYRCEGSGGAVVGTHEYGHSEKTCRTPAGPARLTCTDTRDFAHGGGAAEEETSSACTITAGKQAAVTNGCTERSGSSITGESLDAKTCTASVTVGQQTASCTYQPPVDTDKLSTPLKAIDKDPEPECGA
jgi:hypothetical protein